MRRRESTKFVAANRTQPLPVSAGKIITDYNRKVQRLGYSFNSAHQIHRWTDDGKIKSVSRADIAIDRRSDVKRDDISSGGSFKSGGSFVSPCTA